MFAAFAGTKGILKMLTLRCMKITDNSYNSVK